MKATQPKAELPHLHMPFLNNAMPSRSPRAGRNLTGVFLGVEGSTPPPRSQLPIPPLARGRGMPSHRVRTPTEQKRQQLGHLTRKQLNQMYSFTPVPVPLHREMNIPCLPPMPQSRYPLVGPPQRLVESLRDCEERRGFQPQPIRRRPQGSQNEYEDTCSRPTPTQHQPLTFWDLTRQTPRHFTAATNTGITHLEYLNPDPSGAVTGFYPNAFNISLLDTLARDVHSASKYTSDEIALVECYNRICKGNISTLQRLLPQRQQTSHRPETGGRYTGFTVKSYRNPNQAEIIAQFPPPENRPRTVLGTVSRRTPLQSPSPYFYKTYQPPRTGEKFNSSYRSELPASSKPERTSPAASSNQLRINRAEYRAIPQTQQAQASPVPVAPQPTPAPVVRPAATDQASEQSTAGGEHTAEISGPTDPDNAVTQRESSGENNQEPSEQEREANSNQNNGYQPSVQTSASSIQETSVTGGGDIDVSLTAKEEREVTGGASLKEEEEDQGQHSSELEHNLQVQDQDSGLAVTVEGPSDQGCQEEAMTGVTDNQKAALQSAAGHKLEKMPSGAEIMIGLEDESGTQKPVEIDETDEVIAQEDSDSDSQPPETSGATTPKRRVSITERVLKQRNSEQQLQHLLEEKENRKRELAELLTEHAHLVHEVETLQEGSTDSAEEDAVCGADKENEALQSHTENATEQ